MSRITRRCLAISTVAEPATRQAFGNANVTATLARAIVVETAQVRFEDPLYVRVSSPADNRCHLHRTLRAGIRSVMRVDMRSINANRKCWSEVGARLGLAGLSLPSVPRQVGHTLVILEQRRRSIRALSFDAPISKAGTPDTYDFWVLPGGKRKWAGLARNRASDRPKKGVTTGLPPVTTCARRRKSRHYKDLDKDQGGNLGGNRGYHRLPLAVPVERNNHALSMTYDPSGGGNQGGNPSGNHGLPVTTQSEPENGVITKI